jgi:hypothetical protein
MATLQLFTSVAHMRACCVGGARRRVLFAKRILCLLLMRSLAVWIAAAVGSDDSGPERARLGACCAIERAGTLSTVSAARSCCSDAGGAGCVGSCCGQLAAYMCCGIGVRAERVARVL